MGIKERNIRVLKSLAETSDTFTFDEAMKATGLSRSGTFLILYRLQEKGWIERIEKGKYIIIPLSAEKGKYTLNQFVIGSMLVEPYCISYWSALHHYGFTEQIPATVFIQTTARKKHQNIEIFGINYQIVRLTPEKFFGQKKEWFNNDPIMITNKEKTLVDCLDKPQYCGGVIEAIKGLKDGDYDTSLIAEYAEKMKNTGVIRRLGYISDYYGLDIKLPDISKSTRNYLCLDPTMPDEGEKDSKWRLTINLKEYDLESIE